MGGNSTYDFSLYMTSAAWAPLPSYLLSEVLSDSMKYNGDGELSDGTFLHILWK